MLVYILAGGRSKRMGTDKGLVSFKGKALIEHVIQAIGDLPYKIITSNKAYEKFGTILQDIYPKRGPLTGCYTALIDADGKEVIVLPCDMPLITSEIIQKLSNTNKSAYFESKDKKHFFPLKLKASLKEEILNRIMSNQLRVQDLLEMDQFETISANEYSDKYFVSINEKSEIDKYS